ncbi:hypothetical protein AGLY_006596 [Aphis glycines]|uniref:CCHC-type domain-containing protein n=1 Tax=Aphis glycines TaxID=307491 RepID=A0A6G0TRP7_APHGL|nr:hypothetical protein AGLY_006596 [Aphis glycines]
MWKERVPVSPPLRKVGRNVEVLVRVTRGEERRANLESAIKEALGTRATVRGLIKYDDLDITGLVGVTTENEVSNALMKAAGLTPNDASIRIKNVRPAPNGTKRATASMRSSDAVKILKEGHIQIGLVWAKIRLHLITKRCFRCLDYGHSRFKCTGPDRTEACSLCTSAGHKAAECKNPPKCASCEDIEAPKDHYPGNLTFATPRIAQKTKDWIVLDEVTLTDHYYLSYEVDIGTQRQINIKTPKIDVQRLGTALTPETLQLISNCADADRIALALTQAVLTCREPERSGNRTRRSVHWWSPEVSALRRNANHLRRVYQRKKKRLGPDACVREETDAKKAKRELISAIESAKEAAWNRLCDQVQSDTWGLP